eukprot:SAG31_NODE_3436_length_4274_cov_4.308263_3_plen_136_part_00
MWAEASNEGTSASRDDILCDAMLNYFDHHGIDVPAVRRYFRLCLVVFDCRSLLTLSVPKLTLQVVIDMCGSSKSIIRRRRRINALSPEDKQRCIQALTDIWHARKGVKVRYVQCDMCSAVPYLVQCHMSHKETHT